MITCPDHTAPVFGCRSCIRASAPTDGDAKRAKDLAQLKAEAEALRAELRHVEDQIARMEVCSVRNTDGTSVRLRIGR